MSRRRKRQRLSEMLPFAYESFFALCISVLLFCAMFFVRAAGIKTDGKYVFTEHREIRGTTFNIDPVSSAKKKFKRCPNCIIHNNNPKNKSSSPRDCVLSICVRSIDNIFPFVRSLRTTGCKATVVVLFDDIAAKKLTLDIIRLFKNCSVHYFDIGTVEQWKKKITIFALKHMFAYDFIYKTASIFDRVLLIDLLDVVFQDDPFTADVDPTALTVVKESRKFADDSVNCKRVEPLMKIQKYMTDSQVLNGGILFGSPEVLMKYETFYFSQFNLSDVEGSLKTCDQGYLNYFYLSGILDQEFKLNLWHRDQGYESLASTKNRPTEAPLGDIYYLHKRAIVIHMFDRSDKMIEMVLNACPQGSYYVPEKTYTRFRHNGLLGKY